MAEPATTPERQRIDKYNRDPKFKRELDAQFAHQHRLSESELSGGSPANVVGESRTKEERRISAANSNSNPNSCHYYIDSNTCCYRCPNRSQIHALWEGKVD